MSFRIEDKFNIDQNNLYLLLNWIKKNNGSKIYPDRKITSIYFDNKNFDMYHDSQEGLVPRKKLRIRNYNDVRNFSLETKISSVEGRYKFSKNINNFKDYISKGIFDNMYGLCKPIIEVEYKRSYFNIFNFRFTIDVNISYSSFAKSKSKIKKIEKKIIAEIKNNNKYNIKLMEDFPFTRIRFSKYCNAIQLIYNLN